MQKGKALQKLFAMRRKFYQNLTPVFTAVPARKSATFHEPVDEFDCAVMPKTKPGGKRGDRRTHALRQAFYGEQKLVLLWLNTAQASGFFAEVQKLPDAITELGKLLVSRNGDILLGCFCSTHNSIVSRYSFPLDFGALLQHNSSGE